MEFPLLSIEKVTKSFGPVRVLENISLHINAGESVFLLGANGSGKTTLLKLCVGLLSADSGEILAEQRMVTLNRNNFAYVTHQSLLYANLTVRENLEQIAFLKGWESPVIDEIKRWGLFGKQDRLIKDLSKGDQARAALCRALFYRPRFIILDEPTSALDDKGVDVFNEEITELLFGKKEEKRFVFMATHDLSRVEKIATRIVVLSNGKICVDSLSLDVGLTGAVNSYRAENR